MPGSLPHPNPTPTPELIAVVTDGQGDCVSRTVKMRADYVPAFGTVLTKGEISYTAQVLQTQLITMTQKCINNVYDPYYKLQALNVTNTPLV